MGFYTEKDEGQAAAAKTIEKLREENSRLRGRAYRATHTTPGTHSTACITWGDDGQGNLFNGERVTLGACSCGAWPAWLTRERDEARAAADVAIKEHDRVAAAMRGLEATNKAYLLYSVYAEQKLLALREKNARLEAEVARLEGLILDVTSQGFQHALIEAKAERIRGRVR